MIIILINLKNFWRGIVLYEVLLPKECRFAKRRSEVF